MHLAHQEVKKILINIFSFSTRFLNGDVFLAKLSESSSKSSTVRGILASIWDELQDIDSNYAHAYIKWCLEKLQTNKKHWAEANLKRALKGESKGTKEYEAIVSLLKRVSHRNIPKGISKGEIVHIRFGMNLGDELSDIDKNQSPLSGHYGIVLAQKGFMFLVIPLTSQPQPDKNPDLVMTLKDLGLPGESSESHLSFGKIKAVHIRRINRIHSIPEGKITLPPDKIKDLDSKIAKFLACGT